MKLHFAHPCMTQLEFARFLQIHLPLPMLQALVRLGIWCTVNWEESRIWESIVQGWIEHNTYLPRSNMSVLFLSNTLIYFYIINSRRIAQFAVMRCKGTKSFWMVFLFSEKTHKFGRRWWSTRQLRVFLANALSWACHYLFLKISWLQYNKMRIIRIFMEKLHPKGKIVFLLFARVRKNI